MHSDVYEQLIARNYDAVYAVIRDPSGDAEFYRQLALAAGGPVLESLAVAPVASCWASPAPGLSAWA